METTETRQETHGRWLPDGEPPEGQRLALHRLAAAVRRLNAFMVDTDMGEADLLAAAAETERLADALANGPRGRDHWGYGESSLAGSLDARFDDSPMTGLGNPVSPPMRLRLEEDGTMVGIVVFGDPYEGPRGCVHGGYIAAAFDEVLGMAQNITGRSGMTANLQVDYRSPTPLHKELVFRGRIEKQQGRKIFTSGTLHADGRLCAEASGLFVKVRPEMLHLLDSRRVAGDPTG